MILTFQPATDRLKNDDNPIKMANTVACQPADQTMAGLAPILPSKRHKLPGPTKGDKRLIIKLRLPKSAADNASAGNVKESVAKKRSREEKEGLIDGCAGIFC